MTLNIWQISTIVLGTLLAGSLVIDGYLVNQATVHDAHSKNQWAQADAKAKAGDAKYAEGVAAIASANAMNDSVKADRLALDTDKNTFITWRDGEMTNLSDAWEPLWNASGIANSTLVNATANFTAATSSLENATLRDAEANATFLEAQNLSAAVNVTLLALGKNATSGNSTGSMTCYVVDPSFNLEQTTGPMTVCLVVRGLETVPVDLACTSTKPATLVYRTSDGIEHQEALGTASKTVKGVMPSFAYGFSETVRISCTATKS